MFSLPRIFLAVCLCAVTVTAQAAVTDMYVGTYTKPTGSKGIYRYHFDTESGKVSGGELVAEASNPSFLALRPGGKFLYSVNENDKGEVSAFSVGADGKLTALNRQSSKGSGPCHVFVDPSGKNVLTANYNSGTVAVLPIHEDGSLGEATGFDKFTGSSVNKERQGQPYAHSMYVDSADRLAYADVELAPHIRVGPIHVDSADRFAYACDLGTDWIHGFHFDAATGVISRDEEASVRVPPGSGPRHLAFHPKKDFVYAINELSSTVTTLERTPATGALKVIGTVSLLPANFHGTSSAAEIVMHPSGKFLYGSNRGDDSIAVMAIASDGSLTAVAHTPTGGKNPRNIALDPTGKWLLSANQDTDDIYVFSVDQDTGRLTSTGQKIKLGSPVCMIFTGAEGK